MQEEEIKVLWKAYDQKLEATLQVNRQQAAAIAGMKSYTILQSLKPVKIFAVVTGLLWVIMGDMVIIKVHTVAGTAFLASAIIQVMLTKLAIGIYVYQLLLIQHARLDEPVIATQRRLATLQTTTLWIPRLLFLQLPVWTTFYWNKDMLEHGSSLLWIIQGPVTLLFTIAGIWLFVNIAPRNSHKKWFRLLFAGKEWSSVWEAMELLSQTDDLAG